MIRCPASLAEVTPEWMTQALSFRFPEIRIEALELTKLIEGTATKARYNLSHSGNGPHSLWVKGGFSIVGAHQGAAFANEVNFYRDISPLLSTNRPDSYFGVIDPDTGNGVILLEDLGLRSASFGYATEPLSIPQIRDVLDLQASYHARFWQTTGLEQFQWLTSGGSILESGMIGQFLELWDDAVPLPRFRHVRPAQKDRSRIGAALTAMLTSDSLNPICFVHGDSHIANLFFESDGKPGYLDWQHIMRGHWAFDVANMMVTGLTVENRRNYERELLDYYLESLTRHGAIAPSFDEAWLAYCRHAIWSFMWVLCPTAMHPEEVCSLNAERVCAAVDDLDSLKLLEAI